MTLASDPFEVSKAGDYCAPGSLMAKSGGSCGIHCTHCKGSCDGCSRCKGSVDKAFGAPTTASRVVQAGKVMSLKGTGRKTLKAMEGLRPKAPVKKADIEKAFGPGFGGVMGAAKKAVPGIKSFAESAQSGMKRGLKTADHMANGGFKVTGVGPKSGAKIVQTGGSAVLKPKKFTVDAAGKTLGSTGGGLTTGAKIGLGAGASGVVGGATYGKVKKSDPFEIEKKKEPEATASRKALGTFAPGIHGAIAGKHGRKLKAVGNEYGGAAIGTAGGTVAGGLAGAALGAATRKPEAALMAGGVGSYVGGVGGSLAGSHAGTKRAQRKGHYKPEKI